MRVIIFAKSLNEKSRKEIIDECIELYKEKQRLEKEKEKLEKELRKYKNANTPSSANKHIMPSTHGLKAKNGAKRGAPKGHKGATLILPSPSVIVPVDADKCEICQSPNIEPTGYVKKRKVICYQEAKIVIKEYWQTEYRCLDGFHLFLAMHKDIPEKGLYDKTIQSLVNYYKFKARLPHDIIVDVMNNIHDVPMTSPTSLAITRRASEKLEPFYHDLENEARQADVIGGDETSFSVNGIKHWVWVFCNSLLSLFKFKKERGGDIVEKTLGEDFKGKLVSDGWATYVAYSKKYGIELQRCWDHLKREVKFECEKKHPDLYNWCCDIYFIVKKSRKYKQEWRRHKAYDKCKSELTMLINHMKAHKNLRKLATKIENGKDYWFTTILHPELPMDNNESERSLRPFVLIRKIIGCLRSEIGKKNYEVMMSLISTWEKQQKNVFYTLQTSL